MFRQSGGSRIREKLRAERCSSGGRSDAAAVVGGGARCRMKRQIGCFGSRVVLIVGGRSVYRLVPGSGEGVERVREREGERERERVRGRERVRERNSVHWTGSCD